jgi:TonB family protein
MLRVYAALAMLLAQTASAGAQAPVQTDPWKLGQAPANCYLSRTVGAGTQKADVLIQSFGMSSPYHVVVRSAALPLRPQRAEVAQIKFGSALALQETYVVLGKWNNVATAVFAASSRSVRQNGEIYVYQRTDAQTLAPIDLTGQVLSIQVPDAGPLDLQLGNMSGEFERLDACTQALEAKWSAAASPRATPVKEPQLLHPGEANWHMKYPNVALLNLISGLAEVRMTVDEKGRARDCVVQVSTWAPQFGDDACAALKSVARFEPARDSQGNPVQALFRTSLMFINYKWS